MQKSLKETVFRSFHSNFRYSEYIDLEALDRWVEFLCREESPKRGAEIYLGQPDLPPHSGPVQLMDYQEEVARKAYKECTNGCSSLISLPTGAGKTVTAAHLVLDLFKSGLRRILWLAPQTLLLEQARSEVRRTWWSERREIGIYFGKQLTTAESSAQNENELRLVFDTLQMQVRKEFKGWLPEVVVVDECHHIESNEFGAVLDRYQQNGAICVGLSATPGRTKESEQDLLMRRFGNNLITPDMFGTDPVGYLTSAGVYSCIQRHKLVPKSLSDAEIARTIKGRRLRAKAASNSPGRLDATIEFLKSRDECSGTIVFAYSIAHAHILAAAAHTQGLMVAVVDSRSKVELNELRIQLFKSGEIDVLINVKYVAVGADMPSAKTAILTTPIGSPILFEQIIGRVCRGPLVGGTKEASVCEFDSHFKRFGGAKSYSRFAENWIN